MDGWPCGVLRKQQVRSHDVPLGFISGPWDAQGVGGGGWGGEAWCGSWLQVAGEALQRASRVAAITRVASVCGCPSQELRSRHSLLLGRGSALSIFLSEAPQQSFAPFGACVSAEQFSFGSSAAGTRLFWGVALSIFLSEAPQQALAPFGAWVSAEQFSFASSAAVARPFWGRASALSNFLSEAPQQALASFGAWVSAEHFLASSTTGEAWVPLARGALCAPLSLRLVHPMSTRAGQTVAPQSCRGKGSARPGAAFPATALSRPGRFPTRLL
eukprot:gene22813-biopygen8798